MQGQIDDRGLRDFQMRPKFAEFGDDKLIGSSQWFDADGELHERHVVLTIRDGKIADMQVCGSWRQAKRFAKRAA